MFRTKTFLLEKFGSVQGLLSFLRAYNAPLPGAASVEKWFSRESIPSTWLPVLLAYLEIDNGGPISITKYLEGTSHE
jgi:hypothetical protein